MDEEEMDEEEMQELSILVSRLSLLLSFNDKRGAEHQLGLISI